MVPVHGLPRHPHPLRSNQSCPERRCRFSPIIGGARAVVVGAFLTSDKINYRKQTALSAAPNRGVPSADELGAPHYVLSAPLRRLNNMAHNEPHAFAGASGRVVLL